MTTWAIPASALLAAGVAVTVLSGCRTAPPAAVTTVLAARADVPVKVDGRLDDPVWTGAPAYGLVPGADQSLAAPLEGGRVRFAWDTNYFYMAVDFADADVVAEGTADGEHHYLKGDVAELFLWPDEHNWYWELYVTPSAWQSAFFFPGPGRMLPGTFTNHATLAVAARVEGTFNDWSDRDRGWTAEMAVPVTALTRRGEAWGPGSAWRLLVGRYNYSAFLPGLELTALPRLSKTSFHVRKEYARLLLSP